MAEDADKKGAELEKQRFKLFQEIARELSGETTFPTCFDLVVRLRKALQDPNMSIDRIAQLIGMEPLIPLRLLHLANSAYYRRGGEVKDVKAAINRLGIQLVRTNAMAIAMDQLIRSKEMVVFEPITVRLWNHSVSAACAAHIIARRRTRFNPEEAMLAGLVHDLGAFFLLYRFARHDELRSRPVSALYLAARWHESIGHTLLLALGIPDEIANAIVDHDSPMQVADSPRNLAEVIHVANVIAGGMASWMDQPDSGEPSGPSETLSPAYVELLEEIQEYEREVRGLLK